MYDKLENSLRHLKSVFVLFFLTFSLFAQEAEQPLYLEITFPQHSDTVNADRIRISGHTDPGAALAINNRRIGLFPQGSFVARVALEERMNEIIIVAQKGDDVVRDILFIYRTPVLHSLDAKPTRIDKALIEPENDVWLMRNDYLTVRFKASPGGDAMFSVEKIGKNFPMVELPPNQTRGVAGIYHGVIKIGDAPENQPLKITFEIQGRDGKKKRTTARGQLYVLSEKIPLTGKVVKTAYIHGAAENYLPITRVADGVIVHIVGRESRRYKIDLVNRVGYIDLEDVRLLPRGAPLPYTSIGAPQLDWDQDWLHLTMPVGRPLPFFIKQSESPLRLQLQVIGAQQSSHWISYPNGEIDISSLVLEQADEYVFQLNVELTQKNNWGYRCFFRDGSLHFLIRRQPFINPDNPVENLIFALDPGHGGEHTGAISPLGVMEKDVNRQWAEALAALLRQNGARVMLTREGDETVSLPQRIKRAEAANALFFISLHNNGVTPFGNALAARGTSTYFSLPQNRALSWAIYPHMVDIGLAPYGRIYNSYYVTNSTGFLATLVEGGFLTNPEEELLLADPDFITQMADAVYKGIVDFLQDRL